MKALLGLLVLATLAFGQTANPRRFTATEIRCDVAQLRGNVLMKTLSAIIHAESADFDARQFIITVHGDSRWDLLPVRSQPDFNADYINNPKPITDPARLRASEIHKQGEITSLHGNVEMSMPGIIIDAQDVDFDQTNATLAVRGDSRLVFMKANVEPDDKLGPLWIKR
jgi:hypothetical protein